MEPEDELRILAASTETARQIHEVLSESDIKELKHLQLLVLGRLQDSNAVLSHLNDFSERSFEAVGNEFSRNTRLIKSMKADLDYIFLRIRSLKTRLNSHYPNAFKATANTEISDRRPDLEEPQWGLSRQTRLWMIEFYESTLVNSILDSFFRRISTVHVI